LHHLETVKENKLKANFSIPFIGIFALHLGNISASIMAFGRLSIPFIGIFALHLNAVLNFQALYEDKLGRRSFNSLYWDFCFASSLSVNQNCINPQ
jgi:hypothetical protein